MTTSKLLKRVGKKDCLTHTDPPVMTSGYMISRSISEQRLALIEDTLTVIINCLISLSTGHELSSYRE